MVRIAEHDIGTTQPPFVIAEMSGNHNGSLEQALEIVDMAAAAGAQAIKLQTYTADTMTLDIDRDEFMINDPDSLWSGRSLYSLYEEAHTPWEWHRPIMERAGERNLVCFSSPFDETAVDFLEELEVPCYKIASFECIDLPLIRKVASTGKPVIISTGLASLLEIEEAVEAANAAGCHDLILLKCTSSYPATPDHANVLTISDLRDRFACEVGLSDHTEGIGVAVAAVAQGATVIEKHVTIDRDAGGVDAAFSLEPDELRALVVESDRARRALGQITYGPTPSELSSISHRRSLYITQDMPSGGVLTRDNVRSIRPGHGLPPKYLDMLLGMMVNRPVERGTPTSWDFVREPPPRDERTAE